MKIYEIYEYKKLNTRKKKLILIQNNSYIPYLDLFKYKKRILYKIKEIYNTFLTINKIFFFLFYKTNKIYI